MKLTKLSLGLLMGALFLFGALLPFAVAQQTSEPRLLIRAPLKNQPEMAEQLTHTVEYNSQVNSYYIGADCMDRFTWSFSSSNTIIGITVLAMNAGNFSNLGVSGVNVTYYSLSPGGYTSDSGGFQPEYYDTWYILYWNNDTDAQPTDITYETLIYLDYYGTEPCGTSGNPYDDAYEDNDEVASARTLELDITYSMKAYDIDWYTYYLSSSTQLTIQLNFEDNLGDIDMRVYDEYQNELDSSTGVDNDEECTISLSNSGYVYIKVFVVGGYEGQDYTIELSEGSSTNNIIVTIFVVLGVIIVALVCVVAAANKRKSPSYRVRPPYVPASGTTYTTFGQIATANPYTPSGSSYSTAPPSTLISPTALPLSSSAVPVSAATTPASNVPPGPMVAARSGTGLPVSYAPTNPAPVYSGYGAQAPYGSVSPPNTSGTPGSPPYPSTQWASPPVSGYQAYGRSPPVIGSSPTSPYTMGPPAAAAAAINPSARRFCSFCQAEMPPGTNFCGNCGSENK